MRRFILGFICAAGFAAAQTTVIVQPNPYAQAFADKLRQNDQDMRNSGAQLGNLIAPRLLQVQATMACGKWVHVTAYYSNGAVQNKDIANDDENQQKLTSLLQLNSNVVKVSDLGCAPP